MFLEYLVNKNESKKQTISKNTKNCSFLIIPLYLLVEYKADIFSLKNINKLAILNKQEENIGAS